jgi:hypothetical protein
MDKDQSPQMKQLFDEQFLCLHSGVLNMIGPFVRSRGSFTPTQTVEAILKKFGIHITTGQVMYLFTNGDHQFLNNREKYN